MHTDIEPRHARNLKRLSRVAGSFNLLVGAAVLAAWWMNWDYVLRIVPGYPTMSPNTALALIILGLYLRIQTIDKKHYPSLLSGLLLLAIGISSVVESGAMNNPFWVNHFLIDALTSPFNSASEATFPAPNTGLCFILFGLSLIVLNFRTHWGHWLIVLAVFVPVISLLGQVFQFPQFSTPQAVFPFSGMAIHTAVCLFVAGLGVLAKKPSEGIIWRVLTRTPTAAVLRTVGLASISIPLIFGAASIVAGILPPTYSSFIHMGLALTIVAVFLIAMVFAIRELENSEEKFKSFIENAYDSIFVVDKSGKIEFVNHQVSSSFGYRSEELIGRPIEFIVPDRFVHQHVVDRSRFLENPTARPMGTGRELYLRCKDGTETPVDISLTPVALKSGSVVTAMVRDISERKKIESQQRFLADSANALSESLDYEKRLQSIANQCVPFLADFCVVFLAEDQGVKVRAVSHRDPGKVSLLRETAELYPSVSIANIGKVAHSAKTEIYEEVTEATLYRVSKGEDHLNRLRNIGAKSYLTVPLIAHGKVMGVLSLGILDEKRRFSKQDAGFIELAAQRFAVAADNARLYQKAQQAIRAREDVLSIVSHDLKNPIAAIDLAAQLLITRAQSSTSPEKIKEFGNTIRRANLQMSRLVKGLLTFGQLQANAFSVHPSPMNLRSFFSELDELFRPLANRNSVSLKFVDHGDVTFAADQGALFQALSNLIGNALKFTPPNGSIQITGLLGDDRDLRFLVEDTGPGIPLEIRDKLFDRYWQPESSRSAGAGLGLFIVKGIIEAHNGNVWVESEVGKGTCFVIQIPRNISHEQASERDPNIRSVEDHEIEVTI